MTLVKADYPLSRPVKIHFGRAGAFSPNVGLAQTVVVSPAVPGAQWYWDNDTTGDVLSQAGGASLGGGPSNACMTGPAQGGNEDYFMFWSDTNVGSSVNAIFMSIHDANGLDTAAASALANGVPLTLNFTNAGTDSHGTAQSLTFTITLSAVHTDWDFDDSQAAGGSAGGGQTLALIPNAPIDMSAIFGDTNVLGDRDYFNNGNVEFTSAGTPAVTRAQQHTPVPNGQDDKWLDTSVTTAGTKNIYVATSPTVWEAAASMELEPGDQFYDVVENDIYVGA